MNKPVELARLEPNWKSWRASGLSVQGNVLTGTLGVIFKNDRNLPYNKQAILSHMRLVNRRTADGYGININIREFSTFESWYQSGSIVQVFVLSTLDGTSCAGSAACYRPSWNTMLITPQPQPSVIVHELFHKLGLGHSGSRLSVMYWNQGGRPHKDIRTYDAEVRALVDAYRQ